VCEFWTKNALFETPPGQPRREKRALPQMPNCQHLAYDLKEEHHI
jgi:hypothetical protein